MAERLSFKKTFLALERTLNIVQQRHTHISSNISNLDTPNYRAKDIDFKAALAKGLESAHDID